jgi:protein TonB
MMQRRRQLPLWAGALLLVLAGHAVLAAIALDWRSAVPVTAPSEATIAITLAPLPVVTAPPAAPAEPEIAKPAPVAKPAPPAQKPKPLPLKTVKPAPARPAVKAQPAQQQPRPPAPAPPVATTAAASSVSASSPAAITWQSRLLTHLARFKRYPDDARRRGVHGMNSLRLVIDGSGTVENFALVSTSGSASLDRATLQMIRRAQPLPPPPAELLEDGRVEVVAPVSYTLDKR